MDPSSSSSSSNPISKPIIQHQSPPPPPPPHSSNRSNFHLVSAWSKAGCGTSIIIESNQHKNRIVFDMGTTPSFAESIPAKIVLISHGHIDHFGAIFNHARAHSVSCGGSVPTYYVPASLVPKLERAREVLSEIDAMGNRNEENGSSLLRMDIVGVRAGEEIELPRKKCRGNERLFLRAFATDHVGQPSLGYAIGRTFPGTLKEEFRGLKQEEIRALVQSGVSVKTDPDRRVEVAYTGDTCARGLLPPPPPPPSSKASKIEEEEKERRNAEYLQEAFQCPLLFCELTFLTEDHQLLACDRGHLNVLDIQPVLERHGWDFRTTNDDDASSSSSPSSVVDCNIVFFHLSGRYGPAANALNEILSRLPHTLMNCCDVAIESLLKEDEREFWGDVLDTSGCISLSRYKEMKKHKIDDK